MPDEEVRQGVDVQEVRVLRPPGHTGWRRGAASAGQVFREDRDRIGHQDLERVPAAAPVQEMDRRGPEGEDPF